ncbi:MAG: glycogen debranching enzyme family protein [Spirochaetales bacterium]|nr:glycogen debranching enzyme family protein [Spirochaetales bacterium]
MSIVNKSHFPPQFEGPFLFHEGTDSEWLITNGVGGFASSTITDCPVRKYHGLLVTPLPGKEGRYHILSAIEAGPSDDPEFRMSTNQYAGAIHPTGFEYLESFTPLPFPSWVYLKDGVKIRKEVFMVEGETSVYAAFTLLEGPAKISMDLKMLFTFRDANYTTKENIDISAGIKKSETGFSIRPYPPIPGCTIDFSGNWERSGTCYWDKNIEYPLEQNRGLDYQEDRFVPGNTVIEIKKKQTFILRVSLDNQSPQAEEKIDLKKIYRKVSSQGIKAMKNLGSVGEMNDTVVPETKPNTTSGSFFNRKLLAYMGEQFIVKNSLGSRSINAGFPWFGEWGRDTMIALPGLTFHNDKPALGLDILADYAALIKDGLLPNTLGESQGFTSYNSMDAGLLYCWAVSKFLDSEYSGEKKFIQRLKKQILPAVESIVNAFFENRVPNARLTKDFLLDTGSPETQLTWMDATAWGKPVTPRHGLAVDLNALWYDSLCVYAELLKLSKKRFPETILNVKDRIKSVFAETFLIQNQGSTAENSSKDQSTYLSDTVVSGEMDGKLRPNMLFASSSSFELLNSDIKKAIAETAKRELLTSMGMRTLSPKDPAFAGLYHGNSDERDSVYHQGTVWPWPLGIMIESALKGSEDLEKEVVFWEEYLNNLLDKHLYRQGIGFVSEIFDGLEPDEGKGCFAQAWSTGEILRAFSLLEKVRVVKE